MHKKVNLLVLGGLVGSTVVSGLALTSPVANADATKNATASVTVEAACSMTATVNADHKATISNGAHSSANYPDGIGKTTIQTFCNDLNGYAIYAVGFTDNVVGNTSLVSADAAKSTIKTGTGTDSDVSGWAMKVSAVAGSYTPTITNGFDSFSAVPDNYTKVVEYNRAVGAVDGVAVGSSITTTYAAYISSSQPAGTYTGQVKYTLVHPSTTQAPEA